VTAGIVVAAAGSVVCAETIGMVTFCVGVVVTGVVTTASGVVCPVILEYWVEATATSVAGDDNVTAFVEAADIWAVDTAVVDVVCPESVDVTAFCVEEFETG